MKPLLLLALPITLACSGCVVATTPTIFEKSVTVKRDAQGNIVERVEFERMSQPADTKKMRMQYLDPNVGEPVPVREKATSPKGR